MQTILGSGGVIGVELAKALTAYTKEIRLVSRNPKKVNDSDVLFSADLTKAGEIDRAIEGSEIAYVTVGFPYNAKTWQQLWPPFMEQTIASCKKHKAKMVFFDNIYMYDPNFLGNIDENTPINPSSNKGKVRAQIASTILNEISKGELNALIARSADFYGPNIAQNSMLNEMVFKPLAQNKTPNCMASLKYKHSFTYTPDAGKATAILGNTPDAYGQVWHLSAPNPHTGQNWINAIAKAFGKTAKGRAVSPLTLKIIGLFIPVMREMPEMLYQYDRDYVFDSSKFEKRFSFTPTSYTEGIKQTIKADYGQ